MGEFVKLNGDPAEVIAAATNITGAGASLQADMQGLLADISQREGGSTLGNDDFGVEFKKSYEQSTDAGGGSPGANVATQNAATSVAAVPTIYGNAIMSAMADYTVTDGQAAADISRTTD
jgi:hypothetical protein